MSDISRIPECHLQVLLAEVYNLSPARVELLPLGLDYNAAVYRVLSKDGTAFLVKVQSRALYQPSYLIPRYLNNQGITAAVAPIPTKNGTLWACMGHQTVSAYPFVDGNANFTGMTKEQWNTVGTIIRQIHSVALPPEAFASLRTEKFDPTGYVRWIRKIEGRVAHKSKDTLEDALHNSWLVHQPMIHAVMNAMQTLAKVLQASKLSNVICHADLHPGNLIRVQRGSVFLVDWDEVMLAPKERDFIFVRQPYDDAFYQGYGVTEINWVALTYYLWERVIQDLLDCADNVYFREHLGEESRANCLRMFQQIFTDEGGTLEAAHQASMHLPPDVITGPIWRC